MPRIKTILFDFMGTCLDWHTSIASALPLSIPAATRSTLALHWRQTYFEANASRQASGLPPEDIDITHERILHQLLAPDGEFARYKFAFDADPTSIERCIAAWHAQPAWADVAPALDALRQRGYELVVHANGTTRLQMDLVRNAGLGGRFDMLVSSQIMGCYKPAPEAYMKGLELVKRVPEEVVMVAAHAYDLRGAKEVGIKGVYVRRWSDDILEDQEVVRRESDMWIDGMVGLVDAIEKLEAAE